MSKSSIAAVALVLVMVASGFAVCTTNVVADKGTRDSFGYAWTDSKSPAPTVAFNWIEISSTGTLSGVSGDDYCDGWFPIGFDFDYYGNRYSAFNISTNGYIEFDNNYDDLSDDSIPYTGYPNNIIAIYWHDMYMSSAVGHGIYYQTIGSAPDRQLVVEYLNFSDLSSTESHMTLEIILCENGDIWMQYLTLNGNLGGVAEVGIENDDGTIGCEYSDDSSSLEDGLAIRYSVSPIVIGPSSTLTGTPGANLSFFLTVENKMSVADSIAIRYTSVEGWPTEILDGSWNPLTDTDFDGWPDTGNLAVGGSTLIIVNVSIPASPINPVEYTTVNASAHSNQLLWDACALTSQEAAAWFDPPHSSYAADTDGNGDYNTLTVNASFYCRIAGTYYVTADLYTFNGYYIGYQTTWITVSAGARIAQLTWNTWAIQESGDDGALRVVLELYDNWYVLMDTDVYYTASYLASDFMMRPGELVSPHSDNGVDNDLDGLYEELVLHVSMTANYDGQFRISVDLYDYGWTYMLTETVTVNLAAGSHIVDVSFDSRDLRMRIPDNGPYYAYIYLSAMVRGSWVYNLDFDTHTTAWYDAVEFEAPEAYFQGPHYDAPADTDSDGYYEWLYIDVGVTVETAGNYSIRGDLSIWYTYVDTVSNTTYLDVGYHMVRLAFPGFPIRYNGDSDQVDLDLFLNGESGLLDTDTYSSSTYYYYYDFDVAPGWFVTPYDCDVYDVDSDSLFDYLLFNATVNVTQAGIYEVHAELLDYWSDLICEYSNRTYLNAGLTVFHFAFPGWMIREGGYDPEEILLYLYDEDGRTMDTDYYYTPYYSYSSFENTPASFGSVGNTLYPRDDDSDGWNDTMVMEVNVTAADDGWYFVEGTLYDSTWTQVGRQRTLVWLTAGSHMVTVEFPGWLIHALASNGTYWCYSYLYDSDMHYMDSNSWSGGYWANVFNGTVPMIQSSWAAVPPAINGGMGAGEWSGATMVDLAAADSMNMVDAELLVMNDDTTLYLCFDVYGDSSYDNYDVSAIAFDTGNDETMTPGDEDEFYMYADGTSRHNTHTSGSSWGYDCDFDDGLIDHAGLAGASGFGNTPSYAYDHRIYEYAIPLELLGATMWDVLGFMTATHSIDGLMDDSDNTYSAWPMLVSNHLLQTYGDLALSNNATPPPPVTTHSLSGTVGGGGWYTSSVGVTLNATGGSGGVDHTEYSLDGGAWLTYSGALSIGTDGTHTLRYRSEDAAHHMEGTKAVSFGIDRTAPVTDPGVSGNWVWLNATDPASGVSDIYYRVDSGMWNTYWGSFSVGNLTFSHTVEFYATDIAGNFESVRTLDVSPAAPVTSISFGGIWGGNGWYLTAVNVTLSAVGGSGGVDYTEYRLDAGGWTTYSGMFVVGTNGTHWIDYRSVDMGGQVESTHSASFMIDAALPVTSVGKSGSWIWLNCTDLDSGPMVTMYSVDGGTWTVYSSSFDVGVGNHVIEYYSLDQAGNNETIQSMSLVGPPVTTASLAGTKGSNDWHVTTVTVTLSATGGSGGVARTEYSLDGGAWTLYSDPVEIIAGGQHTFRYRSIDNADQTEVAKTASFKIDTTAPTTASAKAGTWFWLNSTDPHSGVLTLVYRIDGGDWTLYIGGVNMSGQKGTHTVEFYATDAAGNIEETQTLTIRVGESAIAGLLTNPILWIAVIAAALAVLILVLLMMKRRRGQQPMMYPGQPMPPPPQPEYPPPAPPGMG